MKNIKKIILFIWLFLFLFFSSWIFLSGNNFYSVYLEIIIYLENLIFSFGNYASLIYILIFIIRPILFFPAFFLTILSVFLFGPILGFIYTIVGETLSANFAFLISRYFIDTKSKINKKWLSNIDLSVKKNGFITTLFLRLLWIPFDLVNYGLGLTSIKQRDFFFGTFFGIIPGAIIFILFGNLIGNISSFSLNLIYLNFLFIFFILFVLILCINLLRKKYYNLVDLNNN